MFIVLGLLILSFIVIVHEAGHFLAAKAFHVGVVEFAVGMGPKLFSIRIGETVYAIRLLPVGGFCAMYGEESVESKGKGEENEKSKRMKYKTDWTPDRALTSKSKGAQVVVSLAGPAFNFILAGTAAFLLTFLPGTSFGPPVVTDLSPEITIAADAGIEVGDTVLAVENRIIKYAQDYSTYMSTHPALRETGYTVILQRADGSEIYQTHVTPDSETGLIGISYQGAENQSGLLGHMSDAWHLTRHWVLVCIDSLAMLFRGDVSIADMSGFIGMTSFMGNSIEASASAEISKTAYGSVFAAVMATILNLITFISVNLGIMNLLPLPALDGGHALLAWLEGIFNKSVPERAQNLINAVGFGLVLILLGTTTISDVLRLMGVL